ncbi:MAG: hypothetical protein IPM18_15055 [Phycisphaerales bacterium]|nr:hypothetical protein [Phycisphaerales bacterium]
MFRWRDATRALPRVLWLLLAVAALALAGWVHACACTGGLPEWRSVGHPTVTDDFP